jgi:hypothetical protein
MAEIHEAPIVHGTISVNSMKSTSILFSDGSTIDNVDTTLDQNSSNPLANSIFTSTINSITSPALDNFNVHLVMNPSASHNAGIIIFPTRNTLLNDFSSGGPDSFNSVITTPVSGTYTIFFQTTSYNPDHDISTNLVVNGQSLAPITAKGKLSLSTTMTLTTGSQLSLNSNSSVPARSEIHICLVKRDQTLPGI